MFIFKKFNAYDEEKRYLVPELKDYLHVSFDDLNIYHKYYFENNTGLNEIKKEIFDTRIGEIFDEMPEQGVEITDHKGQYIQQEDQINRFIQNILGINNTVVFTKEYVFTGISDADLEKVKAYLINPVVSEEVSEISFDYGVSDSSEDEEIKGFNEFGEKELLDLSQDLAMDLDDLLFLQKYFVAEGRNPRMIELKLVDTYWSDHCRHTTFNSAIHDIDIADGDTAPLIKETLDRYLADREALGRSEKPVCLMDLACINTRKMVAEGKLTNIEKSNEVNACSVEVDIDVNSKPERWLHMFKNETHNHPTQIEPYGGAHTCIGGAIRDPLSGRSKIFQAMRITGAADILENFEDTMENRLPQRYISKTARRGYSDYANQIGVAGGYVKEYYDKGFAAKRMELGGLVAACKKDDVTRLEASAGDLVYLLGAATGRDGLGAAVGSSSEQTERSLKKAGSEVQKGNPFEERKIMRLFDNPKAKKLIKKCNDFGAGGVAVAIGELADGLLIDLDEVFLKYPGMNAYEIALAESQERMAVVIAPEDKEAFERYANDEDLMYAIVAVVNDSGRLVMKHKGETVVDISREFLNSNGVQKHMDVAVECLDLPSYNKIAPELTYNAAENMSSCFDFSIGSNAALLEYGGKNRNTQQLGMASYFPVANTNAISLMAHGYFPEIARENQFMAGYLAVLDSITRAVAMGSKLEDIRLSLQEFFPSVNGDKARFGFVFAALLGAYKAMRDSDLAALGGKDSMSGSFKDLDVPPSLVSFAVSQTTANKLVSRELKSTNSTMFLLQPKLEKGVVDAESFKQAMKTYHALVEKGIILSASTIEKAGLAATLNEMARGNNIGFKLSSADVHSFMPGAIVFEVANNHAAEVCATKVATTYDKALLGVFENEGRKQDLYTNKKLEAIKLEKTVLIPILDGCVGEEDLNRRFTEQGFKVCEYVVKTLNHAVYEESLKELASLIEQHSVLALPHGEYYGATVANNVAAALVKVLSEDVVAAAIKNLRAKGGFILGFGSGFSALLDLGLFNTKKEDMFFTENYKEEYVSKAVEGYTLQDSYFTSQGVYTSIISGKFERLVLKNEAEVLRNIEVLACLEDGSIDAISSKDGRVFGSKSNIERVAEGLYQNIEVHVPSTFKTFAGYFA